MGNFWVASVFIFYAIFKTNVEAGFMDFPLRCSNVICFTILFFFFISNVEHYFILFIVKNQFVLYFLSSLIQVSLLIAHCIGAF